MNLSHSSIQSTKEHYCGKLNRRVVKRREKFDRKTCSTFNLPLVILFLFFTYFLPVMREVIRSTSHIILHHHERFLFQTRQADTIDRFCSICGCRYSVERCIIECIFVDLRCQVSVKNQKQVMMMK